MPYLTDSNIAYPCIKCSRYRLNSKLKSMLKKLIHSSASQVTFSNQHRIRFEPGLRAEQLKYQLVYITFDKSRYYR